MRQEQMLSALEKESTKALFTELYGAGNEEENAARYRHLAEGFVKNFGDQEFELFSSPGRTEIGGNHTDHNHGKVLAGSVNQDCICAARKNGTNSIRMISETFHQDFTIDLENLEPDGKTTGTVPLIRGILAGFKAKGFAVGGFDAFTTSNVISAAGVSSSASFEMLICSILNYFFNDNKMTVTNYAHAGRYAENVYWKKASGLLDQMACASGGIVTIDFKDCENPKVEKIDFSLDEIGCDLLIVNTGKGHANMSDEYSAVPVEMKKAASFFGKEVLAEVPYEEFLTKVPEVRTALGDRCVMRALHFYNENIRVEDEVAALKEKRYDDFLRMICESGDSSWKWLQNCYCIETPQEQAICVALALTELYRKNIKKSACRVHGGGFAGVIMVILPKEYTEDYTRYIEEKLNDKCVYKMSIRKYGAIHMDITA
ncbi:MAG: galactokinase family protein [Eubacteriales bacterium]|nr:galactokinase family protein [Eubacteriales bacterium]